MSAQQTITFANGRSMQVERLQGLVLYEQRKWDAEVQSRGGGGYVWPSGGYVAPASVSAKWNDNQTLHLRLDDGTQTSLSFRNWDIPIRPGARVAVLMASTDSESSEVLGIRNLDTTIERWLPLRPWAEKKGLLRGKMRIWPSALVAAACASVFIWLRGTAAAKAGARYDASTDWMFVAGGIFVLAVLLEWLAVIVVRATDSEPQQVADMLERQLNAAEA